MRRKNFLIAFLGLLMAGALALLVIAAPGVEGHAGNGYGSPPPQTALPVTEPATMPATTPPTEAATTPPTQAPPTVTPTQPDTASVTFCHDNGAGNNPRLTELTEPPQEVLDVHYGYHPSDIIPGFTYGGQYYSPQNDAPGSYSAAILANHCVLQGETTPTQAPTQQPTVAPTTVPTTPPTQTPTQVPGLEVLSISGDCSCKGQLTVANQQYWAGAVLTVLVQYTDDGSVDSDAKAYVTIKADQPHETYDFHIDSNKIDQNREFRLRVYSYKVTSTPIVCGETPTVSPTQTQPVGTSTVPETSTSTPTTASTTPASTVPSVTPTTVPKSTSKATKVVPPAKTIGSPTPTTTNAATPRSTVSVLPVTGSGTSGHHSNNWPIAGLLALSGALLSGGVSLMRRRAS